MRRGLATKTAEEGDGVSEIHFEILQACGVAWPSTVSGDVAVAEEVNVNGVDSGAELRGASDEPEDAIHARKGTHESHQDPTVSIQSVRLITCVGNIDQLEPRYGYPE